MPKIVTFTTIQPEDDKDESSGRKRIDKKGDGMSH